MNRLNPACRVRHWLLAIALTTTLAAQSTSPTQYFFSHLAGPLGGRGFADGPDTSARFNFPTGLAIDRNGNLYVGDQDNHVIRKITPDGTVTTVAGTVRLDGKADGIGTAAQFAYPYGIAVDQAGNLIVADRNNHTIRKITPQGVVTTVAGTAGTYGWTNGTGAAASFAFPYGVAVSSAGDIFVADHNSSSIRKITPDGTVSSFADASLDETGLAQKIDNPAGVAVDGGGTIYVTNQGNHTIRKISPQGIVTTLAGTAGTSGSSDGTGTGAKFYAPTGIAVDLLGNVYVSDQLNHTIRKITPQGGVTTLAGTAGRAGSADGIGAAAGFFQPFGLAVDAAGNVYVADQGNFTIRKITPQGVVSTIAGLAGGTGTRDAKGVAARFNSPTGMMVDGGGNVFTMDANSHTIRKIAPGGDVTTVAKYSTLNYADVDDTDRIIGNPLFSPIGLTLDGSGNFYVINAEIYPYASNTVSICKVTPDGLVSTVMTDYISGTFTEKNFYNPGGLASDSAGNLYLTDRGQGTILKITPDKQISTLAGMRGQSGHADGTGANARFNWPFGIAVSPEGTIYVADMADHTIRKITANGVTTTLAGASGVAGSVDGIGSAARFNLPLGVVVDGTGNVFVTESTNLIRRIAPDGTVTTVGGNGRMGSADGVGSSAQFNGPTGIALDGSGNLYVADIINHAIRKGQIAGPPAIATQPLSQSVASGNSVQFSVTASGLPDPTYQWYFNGSAFSGATGSTLSFSNARSSDAGDYTVVVSNAVGSVTSNKATLTVTGSSAPPTPTPAPSGGSSGGGSIEVWFAVILAGMAMLRFSRRS